MSSVITLSKTFKKEFLNPLELLVVVLISSTYFAVSVLLLNFRLSLATVLGNFPLAYKLNLLLALVFGAYAPLGTFDFWLLILTSLLVGANIVVVFKNLKKLKASEGKLMLSAGGSAVIGVFVAGCSSCGYSIFALIGLTGAVTLFPFEGTLIGILIVGFLLLSLIYSLKTLSKTPACPFSKNLA